MKEILRTEGIDMRDKTLTVPIARDYIGRKVKLQRKAEEQMTRTS